MARRGRLSNRRLPAGRRPAIEQRLLRTAAGPRSHPGRMFPSTPLPVTLATTVTGPQRPVALITGGGRGIGRLLAAGPGRPGHGRRPRGPVARRAGRHGRAGRPRRRHRGRGPRRRHRPRRAGRRPGGAAPAARPRRSPGQQRRHRRPHRADVDDRPAGLVDDHGREPAGPPAHHPAGGTRDGGPRPRPDHQHGEPGRHLPLAAGVRLLGVQGRGGEADREPRPRGRPARRPGLQRAPRAAAHRHVRGLRGTGRRSTPTRRTSGTGRCASWRRAAAPSRARPSS